MAAPLKVATDYDLNEVMLMNMTGNLPRTDNSYRLVIQRFADFHGLLFSSLNREDFTDSNVALFLHDAGVRSSHHVSCEKTYCAALRLQFQSLELPNFRSFPDKYPLITRVLQVGSGYIIVISLILLTIIFTIRRLLEVAGKSIRCFLGKPRNILQKLLKHC